MYIIHKKGIEIAISIPFLISLMTQENPPTSTQNHPHHGKP